MSIDFQVENSKEFQIGSIENCMIEESSSEPPEERGDDGQGGHPA
jgi:hypothetical protein